MLSFASYPSTLTPIPNSFSQRRLLLLRRSNRHHSRRRVLASLPDPAEGVKVEYTPWLIAGLGNPGNKYHGTRHNVGFEMIDRISRDEGISMNTIQSKALVGIGSIGEVPILLVKSQAYMNYSGESIGPLAAYYQVPLRHILLIYDEMSLPNGVMRLQPKGGHGHHNGEERENGRKQKRREKPVVMLCTKEEEIVSKENEKKKKEKKTKNKKREKK
ncbi:chloroplastic group IIB intron splicing facilitator CRS2, chloroplastic-like isoform X2 [Typha angustifolia]|uniref:chloroplastic group IIB intron splicing facilitator CRS2, chloroplastic-like isoform X2 n=1 Tax=Typha angustifolia TaxID=59011 RepID=UPI003C2BDA13